MNALEELSAFAYSNGMRKVGTPDSGKYEGGNTDD